MTTWQVILLAAICVLGLKAAGWMVPPKALDHPTRRGIIFAFGDKDEWSAIELTERLGVPTPHHVKVLREAEPPILVESRQAKRRGATELFYRVNPRLLDGTRGAG